MSTNPLEYFNDRLSSHVGHKVYICAYTCGVCGEISDYMLRCEQEEVDGTCFDDPAGIAREIPQPQCGCNLGDAVSFVQMMKNITPSK